MNMINIIELYSSDEIFANIDLYNEFDKEILVNTIIQKCALYEPMYHELYFLNYNIKLWFSRNKYTFERLFKAYKQEFNPIHNYDRYDDEIINRESKSNGNMEDINQVSPFDTQGFVNDNKSTNSSIDNTNEDTKRTNHSYGNIGVTKSTQMLEDYFKIIPKINVYELIANMFYDEFMIKCL